MTVNQLMICCGGSLTYLIGTFLKWRILAILGTLPCVIQLLGLFFIPESPRWTGTAILFKPWFLDIIKIFNQVGVGLMVLQQFGGVNAVCFYASEIFVSAGFSSGDSGMIAMAAVQVPMTTLGVLLMDRSGRRPLLMVSAAGTCLGSFLVGFSFLLKEHEFSKELNVAFALAGILIYTGSFSLGMGAIPWVIMSKIFPVNLKGTAGSLVTLVSWVGSWIISYGFNFLMMWSSTGTFFIFASICGLTVLFVERLVPETKGRTLEEIQASMSFVSSDKR